MSDTPEQEQLKPWLRSRLFNASIKYTEAIDALGQMLLMYEAKPEDILSQYSQDMRWEIPSRRSMWHGEDVQPRLPRLSLDLKDLTMLADEGARLAVLHGYAGPCRVLNTEVFGKAAGNALIFTPTEPGIRAGKMYSAELALGLDLYPGRLTVDRGNCYRRIRAAGGVSQPIGLISNRESKTPEWLRAFLYDPRGYVTYDTFDAIDRVQLWASKSLAGADLRTAHGTLFRLKGLKDPEAAYQLEQLVYHLGDMTYEPEVGSEFDKLIYTTEALQQLKDIWAQGDGPCHANYVELMEMIIPTYLDEDEWVRIFQLGHLTPEEFDYPELLIIDRRFETFERFFNSRKERVHKRSDRC